MYVLKIISVSIQNKAQSSLESTVALQGLASLLIVPISIPMCQRHNPVNFQQLYGVSVSLC